MTPHRIYFAQHGLAINKAYDPDRPLSQAGIDQTKAIAKILQDSEIPISSVFHSGKLRAAQTAEIFANTMNISSTSVAEGLSPNDDVKLLAQQLNIKHALYVGHLPHMEKMVSYLTTGKTESGIIRFQNSAVVCLKKHENNYLIQWYLTANIKND